MPPSLFEPWYSLYLQNPHILHPGAEGNLYSRPFLPWQGHKADAALLVGDAPRGGPAPQRTLSWPGWARPGLPRGKLLIWGSGKRARVGRWHTQGGRGESRTQPWMLPGKEIHGQWCGAPDGCCCCCRRYCFVKVGVLPRGQSGGSQER